MEEKKGCLIREKLVALDLGMWEMGVGLLLCLYHIPFTHHGILLHIRTLSLFFP